MGCACKEKYSKIAKYSDDKTPYKKYNILETILLFFGRMVMGIFIAALIIIILPLFLIYMFICFLLGKEVIINMKKLTGYLSKHKETKHKQEEIVTD